MGQKTTSARTRNHTALSLASSLRMASGTSSPCSFVDTRSGECGAGPACDAGVEADLAARSPGVAHPHGRFDAHRRGEPRHGKELDVDDLLRRLDDRDDVVNRMLHDLFCQLVGGDTVDDDDESAVRGAHKGEEEPGLH